MKICFKQFLGKNHSWSKVGQELARAFLALGHQINLKSTNGYEHFPEDLKPHVVSVLGNYDAQISYTAFHNFWKHLSHGNKNRFGIWNYEFSYLPKGYAKNHQFTDYILPSSNFSKKIFSNNGIPESKLVMVPHGFNSLAYKNAAPYKINSDKKIKILLNVAQPHMRKNLPGALEAFGRAFTKQDDVCLVLKVVIKTPEMGFEVNFNDIFNSFKKKYPKHGEIVIINQFIPKIEELYAACQITFTMAHTECFWLPGLEGLASGNIVISPRYGGQLDFLNDQNSLLIDGKEVRAPEKAQYWGSSIYSSWFEPDLNKAVEILQTAVNQYQYLQPKLTDNAQDILKQFTWENAAKQIIGLCI